MGIFKNFWKEEENIYTGVNSLETWKVSLFG